MHRRSRFHFPARCLLFLCLAAAGLFCEAPAADTDVPRIRIISPPRDRVAFGATRFAVEVRPAPGRRIVRVRLVVDGKELAVLTQDPYEAEFDAGTSLAAHTLRAEVVDDVGRSGVDFSATLHVSYVEEVEVVGRALPRRAILVGVVDRRGEPITDLKLEEFLLRVEGDHDPLLLQARLDTRPLAVELLLDASGSTLPYWGGIKKGAERFVYQLDEADGSEVSIFAGSTLRVAPFGHDHVATREAILSVFANIGAEFLTLEFGTVVASEFNGAGSLLYDALAHSVEAINVQLGQRSITVLTDAFDTGSELDREQVFDVIRRANIRIDAIRFGRKPTGAWEESTRLIKLMRKLAKETGGQEWRVKAYEQIVPTFELLARQLKGRYRLVFAADFRAGRKERYRKLKIGVSRPGARVLAPAGFFDTDLHLPVARGRGP